MAYYLMVKNSDKYRSIDISKHHYFVRNSKFKEGKFSLKDIDDFTSSFSDEIILREDLFYNGFIDEKEIFKEISIRRKNKDKYEKVMYNPVFKDGKKYFDIEYLVHKIKMLGANADFLNKLLSHYRNSSVNNDTLASLRAALFGNPEIDLYKELNTFVNREVYNYKFNYDKGIYEVVSIKYKSLHDLAMFVYNYENKSVLNKEERDNELKEFLEFLGIKDNKPKTRKRIKEDKKQIEGQMSFLD